MSDKVVLFAWGRLLSVSTTSRILKAYDKSIFELTPSFTVVTFPFENSFTEDEKSNGKLKTTLDVIRDNPTGTIGGISKVTGKSQRTISRELKEYQTTGLLRREGARKNGKWVFS